MLMRVNAKCAHQARPPLEEDERESEGPLGAGSPTRIARTVFVRKETCGCWSRGASQGNDLDHLKQPRRALRALQNSVQTHNPKPDVCPRLPSPERNPPSG
jgi:hypothetical protein